MSERGTGGERAYRTLRDKIVSLELQPGAALDEGVLADLLGLSRTPVREAMIRLASEGLVEQLPNRGARVASMTLRDVQSHLEMFDLIQRAATHWAAIKRSQTDIDQIRKWRHAFEDAARTNDVQDMIESNLQLHLAIGEATQNPRLRKVYGELLIEGLRISRLAMAYEHFPSTEARAEHLGMILSEHEAMEKLIINQDGRGAENLAGSHANLARRRVLAFLNRSEIGGVSADPSPALSRDIAPMNPTRTEAVDV